MHNFHYIEKAWEHAAAYHLIPAGKCLRATLIESCGEDWLNACDARMTPCDATLQNSYIEVRLTFDGRGYWLRNIGYSEAPSWQLSFHNVALEWNEIKFPHQGNLHAKIDEIIMADIQERKDRQRQRMLELRKTWKHTKDRE